MLSQATPIRPLPLDLAAKIKSSISIIHLNGVVVELLKNSLDANSGEINVIVDHQRGSCAVEDNGGGIPAAEFEQNGGLGKAHHSSKFEPGQETHGCKGSFLASLAALSLLTITSRCNGQLATNTIIFHQSKLIARLIPAPPQQQLNHSHHGTRVTVNDLFGNMPVRVRSRALYLQRPDAIEREWKELRKSLTAVLLANEKPVNLVVLDSDKNRKFLIRTKCPIRRSIEPNRAAGNLAQTKLVLTQAGFISRKDHESWVSVSARTPSLLIDSAISLLPSPTRQIQFISLGVIPILTQNNANALYDEVNRRFTLSKFGTTGAPHKIQSQEQELPSQAKDSGDQTGRNRKGTSKAINRWPMFYIRIAILGSQKLAGDEASILESDKSLRQIIDVLGMMIHQFLEQHHFRPRGSGRKEGVSLRLESSSKKRVIASSHAPPDVENKDFTDIINSAEEGLSNGIRLPCFRRAPPMHLENYGSWSKIKSGNDGSLNDIRSGCPDGNRPMQKQLAFVEDLSSSMDTTARARPWRALEQGNCESGHIFARTDAQSPRTHGNDDVIPFLDPFTKLTVFINLRTGQVVPPKPTTPVSGDPHYSATRPHTAGSLHNLRKTLIGRRPRSAPSEIKTPWLDKIVDEWNNPAFARLEKPISSMDLCINPDVFTGGKSCFTEQTFPPETSNLKPFNANRFNSKLRKESLTEAVVIAQVDRKFILARMDLTPKDGDIHQSGSLLVLVDQHAADERCRIERLIDDMFSQATTTGSSNEIVEINTTQLSGPIIFEVPPHEIRLFEAYSPFFASWGCHYDVCHIPGTGHTTVCLSTVPTLIAERCRVEPKLAIDLLRGEIWKREESGRCVSARSHSPNIARHDSTSVSFSVGKDDYARTPWVERIADCPQGIIELLNSRACRSAIMFNDPLSTKECQSLLSRLAQCVFPFQCAHGRPSMLPIINLGLPVGHESNLDQLNSIKDIIGYEQVMDEKGLKPRFIEAFKAWKSTGLET